MRITIAALTLSALLAIGGVLGTTAEVRAELITDAIVEPSVDVTPATTHWPAELEVPALRPGDSAHAEAGQNNPTAANPVLEQLFRDRPRQGARSLIPNDGPAAPLVLSAQNAEIDEDWSWTLDFKESIRPLYEELAAAGVVDAVNGLKFYLELSAPSPLDAPATGAYGALPESASWENPSANPGHQQHAALQGEKEMLITEIMIKELVEAVEPWAFGLVAVYVLWQATRLWLDYSSWRSTHAQKRSARAKRRSHCAPPDTQVTPQLTRHRRLLR